MKEINSEEALEITKRIIPLLAGISVGQAGWVLDTTKELIESTHPVVPAATLEALKHENVKSEGG